MKIKIVIFIIVINIVALIVFSSCSGRTRDFQSDEHSNNTLQVIDAKSETTIKTIENDSIVTSPSNLNASETKLSSENTSSSTYKSTVSTLSEVQESFVSAETEVESEDTPELDEEIVLDDEIPDISPQDSPVGEWAPRLAADGTVYEISEILYSINMEEAEKEVEAIVSESELFGIVEHYTEPPFDKTGIWSNSLPDGTKLYCSGENIIAVLNETVEYDPRMYIYGYKFKLFSSDYESSIFKE